MWMLSIPKTLYSIRHMPRKYLHLLSSFTILENRSQRRGHCKMPTGVLCGFGKALNDTSYPKKYAGLGADTGEGMGRALFEQ
jgi:hypothetical protein